MDINGCNFIVIMYRVERFDYYRIVGIVLVCFNSKLIWFFFFFVFYFVMNNVCDVNFVLFWILNLFVIILYVEKCFSIVFMGGEDFGELKIFVFFVCVEFLGGLF